MSSIFRYLCLVAGAVLIAAGSFVISSKSVQQEVIEKMGRLVASEVIAESSGKPVDPDDSHWSFLGPQIGSWVSSLSTATTSYLLGVLVIVLGAGLLGLAVPAGSFGGGEVPGGSGVNRACLLMLAQASLFLSCGFIAYFTGGFRGGHMFLGTRSAAILVSCAALTSFIRHSKGLGLTGYYSGLILTPILGLNFLRLALKQPVTLDALDVAIVAKALMALSSFVAIIILWRALPTGLDRARASLQVRRLAAGAGAAVLLAGFCITKASLLPKQALADGSAAVLLDDPEISSTLQELGVPEELIEVGRGKLAEMGTGLDDIDQLHAAAAEALTEWEQKHPGVLPEGRSEELLHAARQITSAPPATSAGQENVPSNARNLTELLNELTASEMQQLLREAGVEADLSKPGAMERARQEAKSVDINDPRVSEALNKLGIDRAGSSDRDPTPSTAASPHSTQANQPTSGANGSDAAQENPNARIAGGDDRFANPPHPDRPRVIRPLPSRIDNRIADSRLSGMRVPPGQRATYRTPRPASTRPLLVPNSAESTTDMMGSLAEDSQGESINAAGKPDRHQISPAVRFNLVECSDSADMIDLEQDAWFAPATVSSDDSVGTPFETSIVHAAKPAGRDSAPKAETSPAESSAHAVTSSLPTSPVPPPPPGPDRLSRLEMMIQNTANSANGYGLLAMLGGSVIFLAAVLLRRTGSRPCPAPPQPTP